MVSKRPGRPKKTAGEAKTLFLRVRIDEATDAEFKEAAARVKISVSAWATERLIKAARQEKAEALKK